MLKYCLGCVGIVKNWDCRERCPTDAKQGDWFVFDVICLHSLHYFLYLLMFFLFNMLFGQFFYACKCLLLLNNVCIYCLKTVLTYFVSYN